MAVQDLLESLRNFEPNDLSDVNNVGSWPLAVKAIIWTVAFVAALAEERPPRACLRFAAAAGAIAVTVSSVKVPLVGSDAAGIVSLSP